ncbi:transposase [Halanaerobaculum tunisiense]
MQQENDKDTPENYLYSGIPAFDENNNKVSEQEVINLVKEYTSKYAYYGYRMITNYIRNKEGIIVNHKRIHRIMGELDLLQKQNSPKPEKYNQSQEHEIDALNQMCQMDMV